MNLSPFELLIWTSRAALGALVIHGTACILHICLFVRRRKTFQATQIVLVETWLWTFLRLNGGHRLLLILYTLSCAKTSQSLVKSSSSFYRTASSWFVLLSLVSRLFPCSRRAGNPLLIITIVSDDDAGFDWDYYLVKMIYRTFAMESIRRVILGK